MGRREEGKVRGKRKKEEICQPIITRGTVVLGVPWPPLQTHLVLLAGIRGTNLSIAGHASLHTSFVCRAPDSLCSSGSGIDLNMDCPSIRGLMRELSVAEMCALHPLTHFIQASSGINGSALHRHVDRHR